MSPRPWMQQAWPDWTSRPVQIGTCWPSPESAKQSARMGGFGGSERVRLTERWGFRAGDGWAGASNARGPQIFGGF